MGFGVWVQTLVLPGCKCVQLGKSFQLFEASALSTHPLSDRTTFPLQSQQTHSIRKGKLSMPLPQATAGPAPGLSTSPSPVQAVKELCLAQRPEMSKSQVVEGVGIQESGGSHLPRERSIIRYTHSWGRMKIASKIRAMAFRSHIGIFTSLSPSIGAR